MVSFYVFLRNTIYRQETTNGQNSLFRKQSEGIMPTNREIELDRGRRLESIERSLEALIEEIKKLEEKIDGKKSKTKTIKKGD